MGLTPLMQHRGPSAHALAALSLAAFACTGESIDYATAFIEVEPSRLAFVEGTIDGDPKSLLIRNVGRATLVVSALKIEEGPADAMDFVHDPTLRFPIEIGAGAEHRMVVNYGSTAWRNAVLVIESNADNAPRREVPISFTPRDAPDAGEPDAGSPDAGETDAGTTDAGTTDAGTTDAGTTPDAPCTWAIDSDVEVGSTADGVADLAIASNQGGFTIGWWTDGRELGVRTVTTAGAPTGSARTVFADANARGAWSLVGAADATGAVFIAMSETSFGKKLHRVDLRAAAPATEELDAATDYSSLAMTPSEGGLATLFRKTGAGAGVWARRDGGTAAFDARDTGLATSNTFAHSIAPTGAAFAVAWHGVVGSASPISGARLDATGALVAGSAQQLSVGGTKNLRPVLASTTGGLAGAWMQDSGSKRSAVAARFDDQLRTQTGDVVLGEMGPLGNSIGTLAAAAVGQRLAVAWTRFDASGVVLGFDLGGLTTDGRTLGLASVQKSSLARFTDLAIGAVGEHVIVAYADVDGDTTRIRAAHARCQ